jgi:hypothetical protein
MQPPCVQQAAHIRLGFLAAQLCLLHAPAAVRDWPGVCFGQPGACPSLALLLHPQLRRCLVPLSVPLFSLLPLVPRSPVAETLLRLSPLSFVFSFSSISVDVFCFGERSPIAFAGPGVRPSSAMLHAPCGSRPVPCLVRTISAHHRAQSHAVTNCPLAIKRARTIPSPRAPWQAYHGACNI